MNRYKKFGITIYPLDESKFDWNNKSKTEITNKLRELKFLTPLELCSKLIKLKVKDSLKKNKNEYYFSKPIDFGGQLELGEKNNRPHYQCWLEMSRRITKRKILLELSKIIYDCEISNAISVIVLTKDIEDYKNYCLKEDKAYLDDEYSHVSLSMSLVTFEQYLFDNPDSKKYSINHFFINVG
jgi:hypothetical protein